ncbi:MAG: thiamine phosphate synthase [Chloroflexota bacterium]|nr:thiamine phosphate synthase [Chloroflexota bacterium]
MTARNVDFSLYVITDPDVSRGRMHQEVVRLALEGGATVIQYRDKSATLRRMLQVGAQLRELTRQHGATFIVNDRPDLAIALEADGVQVGPEDLPPDIVRKIVGPDMLIGVSVDHPEDAREAEAKGADYLAARPVFPTRWNADRRPTMGSAGLAKIVQAVNIPVLGAGGINRDNLPEIFKAGAAGPALTSAVVAAEDPREAARRLRQLLDSYRGSEQHAGAQSPA